MDTSKIVKKIYKDWQEYLIFWSWWASIEVDSSLSDSSENPVQNKVVKGAIDAKITNPSWWNAWQVLKKTANWEEWADGWWFNPENTWEEWQVLTKTSTWYAYDDIPEITVDSELSTTSENPVQNKVVKSAIDWKISTPSWWSTWQVLKKTASWVEWWSVDSCPASLVRRINWTILWSKKTQYASNWNTKSFSIPNWAWLVVVYAHESSPTTSSYRIFSIKDLALWYVYDWLSQASWKDKDRWYYKIVKSWNNINITVGTPQSSMTLDVWFY